MRVLTVQIAIIFLVVASACAVENADVSALISQSLKTYKQLEKFNGPMKAATNGMGEQLILIQAQIHWLKQPVPDDKEIYDINSNITIYKSQISTFEAYIEAARITDPKERARLVDKYEADGKRILEEVLDAGKPFKKRIIKLKKEFEDKQKPFEKAMKAYCLSPGSNYPTVASTYVNTTFHTGWLTYKWLDSNNKQLAYAWISLKDKPVIKDNSEMLDNKFYVSSHRADRIGVWAGHFLVNFKSTKQEWQGKEKIAELIKYFIDLEGLAKIDPTRRDGSLNAFAMASLACSKRYHRISREQNDATGHLTAERVKVNNLISRFKKPPADSEQLTEDRRLMGSFKEGLKMFQIRLKAGMVTNPNERKARIVQLEAEKKQLVAEREKITRPYYDKRKKFVNEFKDQEAALNEALKKYFLKGGNAYPGVAEISTQTIFYRGCTYCIWKDADGERLCNGLLAWRNKPAIPKDARMLDGLYYISDNSTRFIKVWAGRFHVYLEVYKSQWLGKDKVAEALKHFIDLAGLAKIE
jgi:hypothetical protein